MDRSANVNRQRHGHQVAFGDETDDLDTQPVGKTVSQPRGVGAPEDTDHDVAAEADRGDRAEEAGTIATLSQPRGEEGGPGKSATDR